MTPDVTATPDVTLAAARFFVALVTIAALVALVARRVAVPYEVGLVLVGLGAAWVLGPGGPTVGPGVVLFVLLPGLVFEASYRLEFDELRHAFGGLALLAVLGVIVSAGVVALVLQAATGMDAHVGFVLGAIVAATDPASVVATFKRLHSPRRLATLVEGESLLNDGTGLVVFAIALHTLNAGFDPGDAVAQFAQAIFVSAIVGGVLGFVASRVVARVDDHLIEMTISVSLAYGAYLIADAIGQSGIIATVTAGIVFGNYGRSIGMSENTADVLDAVWEFVAFLLSALVFILIGLDITPASLAEAVPIIAWGVVAIFVGRALAVYVLLGTASAIRGKLGGRRIPRPWFHVLFWAGLRGAVAVAMALSLPADMPQRALVQETAFGIVLFTLLVQGTTTGLLLRRLHVGAENPRQVESEEESLEAEDAEAAEP